MTVGHDNVLETTAMDLLSIPPLVFRAVRRRVARADLPEADMNLTPLHFEIMTLLEEHVNLHPSEISERLQIARTQMTKLVDRLVELGFVVRNPNPSDRRNHDIALTKDSRAILQHHKQRILSALRDIVSNLSEEDLEDLAHSLRTLRRLLVESGEGQRMDRWNGRQKEV
jgi:DNA-binding MarR family transcriptional regulator